MKFAYDETTGEVIGFNRGAVAVNEIEGNCTRQDIEWGMDADRYKVVDGALTAFTSEEAGIIDAKRASQAEIDTIPARRYEMEIADLDYNGILIPQDRESRSLMADTFSVIRRGAAPSVEWTCHNGYLILDADNIGEIEMLSFQKIQAAFDWAKAEKAKLEG